MSDYVGVTDSQPAQEAHESPRSESVIRRDVIYFVETEWQDTPAMDLVEQHLNILDGIVVEACRVFSSHLGDAA
jgi:hypothetical protein